MLKYSERGFAGVAVLLVGIAVTVAASLIFTDQGKTLLSKVDFNNSSASEDYGSLNGCTTGKPGPDWICVPGGGWVPPSHPLAQQFLEQIQQQINTPAPAQTPEDFGTKNGCTTVKPASDWICVPGGGWVPRDHPLAEQFLHPSSATIAPTPTQAPAPVQPIAPTLAPTPVPVVSTPAPSFNMADINRDGRVNRSDYDILAPNFGQKGSNPADINGDSIVDIFDYNELVENYGK